MRSYSLRKARILVFFWLRIFVTVFYLVRVCLFLIYNTEEVKRRNCFFFST